MKKNLKRWMALALAVILIGTSGAFSSLTYLFATDSETPETQAEETVAEVQTKENVRVEEVSVDQSEPAEEAPQEAEPTQAEPAQEETEDAQAEETPAEELPAQEETESDQDDAAPEQEETAEPAETETEALAYPAFAYEGSCDGIAVTIAAPEGVLPEGTTVVLSALTEADKQAAIAAVEDANTQVTDVVGLNIAFFDASGVEIEPDGDVQVTFSAAQLAGFDEPAMVHVKDDGTTEQVAFDHAGDTVGFTTDEFSSYAVLLVDTAGTSSDSSGYSFTFTPTIANADVKYVYFNNANGAAWSNAKSVDGTFTISNFASKSNNGSGYAGYIVFFVKANADYLLTGLGASGNGDMYPTNGSSFGNINGYPGMSSLAAAAYDAGYIACFGFSRSAGEMTSNNTATLTVSGVQPSITVTATSSKTTEVVPGDELTFTVTVTPQTIVNEKTLTVESGQVTKLTINGTEVSATLTWDESKKAYTGTVPYVATDADCESGEIKLSVEATVDYSYKLGTSTTSVTTNVTIKNSGTTTCKIASKAGINYKFAYEASDAVQAKMPDSIKTAPVDSNTYYNNTIITVDTKYTNSDVVYDSVNEGYWTFSGWKDSSGDSVGAIITANGNLITLTGTWTFHPVTLTAEGYEGTYDGESHGLANAGEVDGAEATLSYAISDSEDGTYTDVSEAPTRTDAGTTYVKITAKVNDDLTISKVVKITINKRTVTLTSASATKEYDGTALIKHDVTVGGDDFAKGQGATYNITGSQTLVGSSKNEFTYILKDGTNKDNYDITCNFGTLTVTNRAENAKYEITVEANSKTVTYDGSEQTVSGIKTDTFTVNGQTYTVSDLTAEAKGTNAGEYTVNVTGTAVVKDAKGNDVTDQFIVHTTNGKLTIEKRTVTITSQDATKPYDGTALTKEAVTVTGDGFATGEGATYTYTGSQTLVGSSENYFSYTLSNGTNAKNYNITTVNGTLTVTNRAADAKYEITVEANSDAVKYDGTEQTVSGIKTDTFTVNGQTYTVSDLTAEAKGTDAGDYSVKVKGDATVTDAAGNDVTDQFAVKKVDGTLTINKRNVTLTSASDSKVYDGTALTKEAVTVTGDGFATGEGATYTYTGTQTLVGHSDNYFSYSLNTGTNADNYTITTANGTLTVIDRDAQYAITVEANSGTEKYDGTEKTVSGIKTDTFTVNGQKYTVSGLSASASGTDAGTYTVTVTGTAVVKDAKGNDVTDQFAVTTENGKLTINQRKVTLTSASDSKVYDGTALTKHDVAVTGDGFATGEGATYNITGSQTLVGSSKNYFTYSLNSGTKAANYEISTENGALEVTGRTERYEITVVANSGTEKYDGSEKSVSGFKTLTFEVNGQKYTVSGLNASASGTDAGEYTVTVTGTAVVKDAKGNDVTAQFIVKTENGKLTISKRTVTLTSASAEKEYDGTALTRNTQDDVTVGGDDFADNEGAIYSVIGSQTTVGSSENEFYYSLNNNTSEDNYTITKTYGTLKVTNRDAKYEITVEAKSGTELYDGSEKSVSGFETLEFTVNNQKYTVSGLTAEAKGTNAGEYAVNVVGTAIVKDAKDNDVTDQFTVKTVDGKLTIGKRSVTLTSATAEKKYDGTALTKHDVAVTGDGFATGEGAAYTYTGSQTLVGSSENYFSYTLSNGTNADNYNITTVNGTLKVTNRDAKYEITVEANSGTEKYDGTEKTVSGFKTLEFTVNNQKYTVSDLTAEAKGTNAGEYTVNVTGTAVVKDAKGNDVTDQFRVNTQSGKLTIEKRTVTITSQSDSKEYDGTALIKEAVTVTGDGFADGEGATYTYTGSQTLAGHSENYFKYTLNTGTKAENYNITTANGTLTVTNRDAKYAIKVEANSGTEKYDGTEKTVSGFKTLEFTVNNQKYTVSGLTAEAKGTNAGEYTVTVTGTAIVKDAAGNDVTDQFAVTTENGKLTINKRTVTLTSASDSKVYDGTALTKEAVTVTGDGFADGEGAAYSYTGSQTLVGSSDNYFSYSLNKGTNADNYTITTANGTLTVIDRTNKYEVTVEANSGTAKYDGTEKTVGGIKTDTFTVNGQTYTVSGLSASASGTDAGEYTVNVTGTAVVKDAAGNDVTAQFKVNTQSGKLTIEKRTVTITSQSDSKEYDGTALTKEAVTVTGDGFAGGEGAAYTYTGSQTLVGSSDNYFSYSLNKGTNADNYTITTANGTLTVIDRTNKYEVTVEANSGTEKYDGGEKTVSGFKALTFQVDGQTYTVSGLTAEAKGTDAGTYNVTVTGTAVVKDAAGNDVTSQFAVTTKKGTLTIEQRTITLTSANGNKLYDGKALTKNEQTDVTVSGDGFADNEGATYTFTGSQTLVGHSENYFDYVLNEGTKAANYIISTVNGMLTVTDAKLNPNEVVAKTHEGAGYNIGDTVTFDITVTNIYDEAKTITLTEQEGVTLAQAKFENVKPGDTVTTTATYVITEADILAHNYNNVVTATFSGVDQTYTTEDNVTLADPDASLVVNKKTTSEPKNGTAYALGETIGYEITVTNDGNVTIKDVVVTDELTGDKWPIETLEPGESSTMTAEYVVTEADIRNGSVLNTATATGVDPEGEEPTVDPGNAEDKTETKDSHLTLTKTTTSKPDNGTAYALGETITYEIVAKNDGNQTLTNVVVTDELTGGEWTIDEIKPGDTSTMTTEYEVTEADVRNGSVLNVATATGTDPEGKDPTVVPDDAKDDTVKENSSLTLTKTVVSEPKNGSSYALGETVKYEIVAKNDGNQTLTNVVVTDELTGGKWTIDEIKPGQRSTVMTTEYVVTEADILKGSVLNVATATGTDPDGEKPTVTPGDVEVPTEQQSPSLFITKVADKTSGVKAGDVVTYTITVTNNGNVTIDNIEVKDELTGDVFNKNVLNLIGTISLAPGESRAFTVKYTVTQADLINGTNKNVATVTGTDPDKDPVDNSTEEDVTTEKADASYTVTKTVTNPQTQYNVGDTINYNITVVNTGNLTLNDLVVDDQMQGASGAAVLAAQKGVTVNGNVATIAALEPGESITIQASYTVVRADADSSLSNKVTVSTESKPGETPNDPDAPTVDPGEVETPSTGVEKTYLLTIHYVDANGNALAADFTARLLAGDTIDAVVSPTIEGYTPNYRTVSLPATGMPAADVTVTVVYTPIVPAAPTDPTTPTDPTVDPDGPNPAVDPDSPEGPNTPNDGDDEGVDGIIEPTEDGGYDLTKVEDVQTPLANTNLDDHSCDILHFLLMLLNLILFGIYTKSRKNRQLKVEELKEQLAMETIQKELGLSDEDMAKFLEAAKEKTNA